MMNYLENMTLYGIKSALIFKKQIDNESFHNEQLLKIKSGCGWS